MGCDIHMYVEYKRKNREKQDIWIHGDYFKPNPYYDGKDKDESKFERMELYGSRNYSLFSTLAGVRDYTHSMIPVSEPKGLPKDICQYIKESYGDWAQDAHNASWLTLKELKDYQQSKPIIKYTGLLSPIQLKEFDEKGVLPNSWCQGTNMEGFERRNWEEENNTLIPLIDLMTKRVHELIEYGWEEYNPENDEKIRIVFWFDN